MKFPTNSRSECMEIKTQKTLVSLEYKTQRQLIPISSFCKNVHTISTMRLLQRRKK